MKNEFIIENGVLVDCKVHENPVIVPNDVNSIGDKAFYYCVTLKKIIIPNTVTSIGYMAFSGCISLKEVKIPSSITIIGESAFKRCWSLKEINIPDSVISIGYSAFPKHTKVLRNKNLKQKHDLQKENVKLDDEFVIDENCVLVRYKGNENSIIIPRNVRNIGTEAFYRCENLEEIEIQNSVTNIEDRAFYGCYRLKEIKFPESIESIGTEAFACCYSLKEVKIPSSLKNIGELAFPSHTRILGNKSVAKNEVKNEFIIENGVLVDCKVHENPVIIPNNVKSIGKEAFYRCKSLEEIVIPESIISIGESAFEECYNLKAIKIPSNVTHIGNMAFKDCYALKEIKLPDSLTNIGDWVFYRCKSLKEIELSNNITSIGKYAFHSCESLRKIKISDSMTSIGDMAFYGCYSLNLKEIKLPNSVTHIGEQAFPKPKKVPKNDLKPKTTDTLQMNGKFVIDNSVLVRYKGNGNENRVIIPNGVIAIGDYAFNECKNLKEVIIPSSVKSIGSYAFYGCYRLKEIKLPDSLNNIGYNAFPSHTKVLRSEKVKKESVRTNYEEMNHFSQSTISQNTVFAVTMEWVIHYTDGDTFVQDNTYQYDYDILNHKRKKIIDECIYLYGDNIAYIEFTIIFDNNIREKLETYIANGSKETKTNKSIMPRRSIDDNNTWFGLQHDIENMKHSTKTIFKFTGENQAKISCRTGDVIVEPLYLYDDMIYCRCNGQPALILGDIFQYAEDVYIKAALTREYSIATKIVIGNETANFIKQMLAGAYGRIISKDEFLRLCEITSNFRLYELDTDISKWLCKHLSEEVGLNEVPLQLRTDNFEAWRSSYPRRTYKYKSDRGTYSIGCVLENLLLLD